MSQRQKAFIGSIGMAGIAAFLSGCSHSSGDAAAAGVPPPAAPPIDARTQQEIDKRRAGAQFDAQQRAAGMALRQASAAK